MATIIIVLLGLVAGLVGGLGALCVRLVTPGQTFLQPPDPEKLGKPWGPIMKVLTYTADLILGAIAGLVVLGVGGIDPSDRVKLIATCIVAGFGGSGFLTNLGTKLQAESNSVVWLTKLQQTNTTLDQVAAIGEQARQQVEDNKASNNGEVPEPIADQLSNNLAQIQAVTEIRPTLPPEVPSN